MTTQKRGPSPERIKELESEGYSVHMVVDQDPVLYGWMQSRRYHRGEAVLY